MLLDGGRITEEGTHGELMALRGTYAELFGIQAARFRRADGDTDGDVDGTPAQPNEGEQA